MTNYETYISFNRNNDEHDKKNTEEEILEAKNTEYYEGKYNEINNKINKYHMTISYMNRTTWNNFLTKNTYLCTFDDDEGMIMGMDNIPGWLLYQKGYLYLIYLYLIETEHLNLKFQNVLKCSEKNIN